MIVSDARIKANQANAAKSTGPKTEEGKNRSRANALKHGLCASVLVPEDQAAIQRRSIEMFEALRPQNPLHSWLVSETAVHSIRIDRCERIERRVRDKNALRAELTWDEDRKLEVELLARSLLKSPPETVARLRQTPHGCDWLIDQWAMLAHAADAQGSWNDEQVKHAFDLFGTPLIFRKGRKPGMVINYEGRVVDPGDDQVAVARRQVALLREHREVVVPLDEVNRSLASSDLVNEGDPELRRLRRYEATLHNRVRWCLKELRIQSPFRQANPDLRPDWVIDPSIEPEAEPELPPVPKHPDDVAAENWSPDQIHPPFDLTPDEFPEPGQKIDMPKIQASRRDKRLKKAEEIRRKRREKLDRLRA